MYSYYGLCTSNRPLHSLKVLLRPRYHGCYKVLTYLPSLPYPLPSPPPPSITHLIHPINTLLTHPINTFFPTPSLPHPPPSITHLIHPINTLPNTNTSRTHPINTPDIPYQHYLTHPITTSRTHPIDAQGATTDRASWTAVDIRISQSFSTTTLSPVTYVVANPSSNQYYRVLFRDGSVNPNNVFVLAELCES